ncbi:AbrB/MazE/SpoVT family DNA-binding domain-containing protein [Massilia sp. BJB1822]|uniref:AbrB/MazE/SpoVT family DNA-binding domain-containing protein n=1 Tax=Massilia sp. BJB1822 TaxID=2744470 RepID=UPI001593D249|nr:AbrB/MazE/SpoVT family DNA-binding domain-containing protein [Massilia sp. BJB1822]NVD98138.1 PbsX family transcriptional regulator [Massilia sp. BJB1822]
MELSIQEWDESAAVKLPAALLTQLKLTLGDKLVVDVRPDGIMLKPVRPSYTLEELIAQCDPDASMPADMEAWQEMPSVGRESW